MSLKRWVFIIAAAISIGALMGLRLPEEKRRHYLKLAAEAKEMPFRLFV